MTLQQHPLDRKYAGSLLIATTLLLLHAHALRAQQPVNQQQFNNLPSRKWTSADGKYSVQGKLAAIEGEKVSLALDNGKRVGIELAKLSAEDQQYVAGAQKEAEASPFLEENEGASPFMTENPAASPATVELGMAEPDATSVVDIDLSSDAELDLNSERWNPAPVADKAQRPFQIKTYSVHASTTGALSNMDETLFAISFHNPFGRTEGDSTKSWMTLVDLTSSKIVGEVALDSENMVLGDLSRDGKEVLLYNGRGGTGPEITIARWDGQRLQPRLRWNPSDAAGFHKDLQGARLLANGDVVAETFDQLIVWQLDPLVARHRVGKQHGEWQLASDRRHALIGQPGKRFEIDLIEGVCTATESNGAAATLAVLSPNGERRAELIDFAIRLSKPDSDDLLDEFYVPIQWPNAGLRWMDDRYLEVTIPNRVYVVDTTNRVALSEVVLFGRGNRHGWVVDRMGLAPPFNVRVARQGSGKSELPPPERLANDLPESGDALLVLEPGSEVQLDVQLAADPGQTGAVKSALTQLLEKRGVKVTSQAELVLRARSESKKEEVEYQSFGSPPWRGGEKVNVTTTTNTLQLVRGEEVLWSHGNAIGPGFMLLVREGETTQQAADRAAAAGKDFWTTLKLPRHLARHPVGGAWFSFHHVDGAMKKVR